MNYWVKKWERKIKEIEKKEQREKEQLTQEDLDNLATRPVTRKDCEQGERPCPWMACRYNLLRDININGKSALKNKIDYIDIDKANETCALDVADQGGASLEDVGRILNITREGVRLIEVSALAKLFHGLNK